MSPTNRRLYHITHIEHVESIIQNGLLCDNEVNDRNSVHIAYAHLKERRQTIEAPPGGHVSDYVPFYFARRSPMLYLINKGEVETYRGGQADVVHLVTTIQRIVDANSEFFYSDRNACTKFAQFKTDIYELNEHVDWEVMESTGPRWIINFPTKGHWRGRSKLDDIANGLDHLRTIIQDCQISSIAIPPLGCGLGGLSWADVEPLIRSKLDGLELTVRLFAPAGAPPAAQQVTNEPPPALNKAMAALIKVIGRYSQVGFGVSQIEVQKLVYFLQEMGEPLPLRFTRERYGPYDDKIRRMLSDLEGHYTLGFGDGTASVGEAELLRVINDGQHQADSVLAGDEKFAERMDQVFELAEGYETPYGLELLATVHWCIKHNETSEADQFRIAKTCVADWNKRKRQIFTDSHIEAALVQLDKNGLVLTSAV